MMNANNNNDDDITKDASAATIKDEIVCPGCGEDLCVFVGHEESLVALDKVEHLGLAPECLPLNNVRQKALHQQLTLMINRGPLGAGVCGALLDCCVLAIREMLPSEGESFMGLLAQ
jgi:hypothetical protein